MVLISSRLLACNLQETADPFLLLPDGIVDEVSRAEHAGIDADEGEVPHEGVVHDLEGEGREGFVVWTVSAGDFGLLAVAGRFRRPGGTSSGDGR